MAVRHAEAATESRSGLPAQDDGDEPERAGIDYDLPLAPERSAGALPIRLALHRLRKDLSPSTQDHSTATASLRSLPGSVTGITDGASRCGGRTAFSPYHFAV